MQARPPLSPKQPPADSPARGRAGRWLLALALVLLAGALRPAHAADDFLPPEQAFGFSVRALDARSVEVRFAIEPGYYLYREQFKFAAPGATLGAPVLPQGKVKFDETFQKNVETYRGDVRVVIPVEQAPAEFRLVTTSQGCADAGLCYPPMQSPASVSLAGFGGSGDVHALAAPDAGPGGGGPAALGAPGATPAAAGTGARAGSGSAVESVLKGGAFWPVVGAFFLAGLLLSLTPCVLPMLPIVSSIIVGHGGYRSGVALAGGGASVPAPRSVSRGRGLALAASYSLGMAIVYTAFGVAAGLAGEGLAAALQNPWVLGAFAVGLVALALSMFGVYELQLPQAIACRMTAASQRLPAGQVAGVCAMGGVSALIVSPCVAAPLAGALLYLSQTRDVWLGGTALFSMAAGMSVPLLLVGASAGALLPRAGAWMVEVRIVFGILLLGVALWTVQPVLPAPLAVALWGTIALAAAATLFARGGAAAASAGRGDAATGPWTAAALPHHAWRHALAALLAFVGVLQLVGAASGATDPLQPLAPFASRSALAQAPGMPRFALVRSVGELDAALRSAGRPVDARLLRRLVRLVQGDGALHVHRSGGPAPACRRGAAKADVTANNEDDKALLRRFHLFGPPGTIFFDPRGEEVAAARLIGFQNSGDFLRTLRQAGL